MNGPSRVVAHGYRVADRYPVDVAALIRAATFVYRTLSAAHTSHVQIGQVRLMLADALREVPK